MFLDFFLKVRTIYLQILGFSFNRMNFVFLNLMFSSMRKMLFVIVCFSVSLLGNVALKAQSRAFVDFTSAAEKTLHTVVHIQCELTKKTVFFDDFFSFFMTPQTRNYTYQTAGSGVIISSDGYIITNNHVVQGAEKINVVLNDKRSFVAELVGNDPSSDLAVIKIKEKGLDCLSFGNSDLVRVGEWVLAVGNPFNLTSTVTAGIVSAKARDLNIWGENMSDSPIKSFIQTDAVVNPGNSGGALVNLSGELVGINTAISSSTGHYEGYSFAIPSNIVKKVTSDLINYGLTQKAYLNLHYTEVDNKLAEDKGLSSTKGVYVAKVIEGGASYKAGIKEGDIILKVDSKTVNSNSELNEVLSQHSPGDVVVVEVEREGKVKTFEVTLYNSYGNTDIIRKNSIELLNAFGGSFRELTKEEKVGLNIESGIVVEKVGNSPLGRLGIKEGFVITTIDGKDNISLKDIKNLEQKKGMLRISGFYPREKQTYSFVIVL